MPRPISSDRAPRIDLRRAATLINSDGATVAVVILDLWRGGFRVEACEDLRIGEQVTLLTERGDRFSAEIRWTLGNEAGGMFLDSGE